MAKGSFPFTLIPLWRFSVYIMAVEANLPDPALGCDVILTPPWRVCDADKITALSTISAID
jgi:hypothetical protein